MCEHSAKSWRPLHARTHMYIYSYTLFTLCLNPPWHSLLACFSKKLGIPLFMAPWNELLVTLLPNPHWFSVVQLTLVPVELSPARALRAQMGSFAPAVLCILPRSVLDILKPTFIHSIPVLGHRLLSSLLISWNKRSNIYVLPSHRMRMWKGLHTLCLSQGDEHTESQYTSSGPSQVGIQ